MVPTDTVPAYETSEIGTPKDYRDDLYRVYFEVGEHHGRAREILESYLGKDRKGEIEALAHGYIVEIALQCTPGAVERLTDANIAIYQVNRFAKSEGTW